MTSQHVAPARMGTQVVSAGPLARRTIPSAPTAPIQNGIRTSATISFSHFTAAASFQKTNCVETPGLGQRSIVRETPVMGAKEVRDRSPGEELNTASPDNTVCNKLLCPSPRTFLLQCDFFHLPCEKT